MAFKWTTSPLYRVVYQWNVWAKSRSLHDGLVRMGLLVQCTKVKASSTQ